MAKTKTKANLRTVLTFVQDETSSMQPIAKQTIDAFNEYFSTLKRAKEIGTVEVLISQFSLASPEESVRVLYEGALKNVPKLTAKTYRPRGITPLLDAVGTAVTQTEAKEADRYLFIVQTDGHENASKEYTYEKVAKLMAKKEKAKNWTVVFLGAGIANWGKEAGRYGVAAGQTVSYAPARTQDAYGATAMASASFLRTNSAKGTVAADTTELLDKEKPKKQKTPTK